MFRKLTGNNGDWYRFRVPLKKVFIRPSFFEILLFQGVRFSCNLLNCSCTSYFCFLKFFFKVLFRHWLLFNTLYVQSLNQRNVFVKPPNTDLWLKHKKAPNSKDWTVISTQTTPFFRPASSDFILHLYIFLKCFKDALHIMPNNAKV